jgi:hypothetical protein
MVVDMVVPVQGARIKEGRVWCLAGWINRTAMMEGFQRVARAESSLIQAAV